MDRATLEGRRGRNARPSASRSTDGQGLASLDGAIAHNRPLTCTFSKSG